MERKLLQIQKKIPGEHGDGYKVFSIRVKVSTLEALETLARESNRSRNEIINILLEHGVAHSGVAKE